MLPMYRIRHKKTAPNVIFDFPNVESIVTHGRKLSWEKTQWNGVFKFDYTLRGILPIVQPYDPFYDFVKQFTTPAPTTTTRPPPTTTTLKPVPAGPAPKFPEIQEDSMELENRHVIDPLLSNVPAISGVPIIYYMLAYIAFHLKSYNL
uniref:Transmembrane protein n=2 Tax=Bursaphelenchus xylophilus TaxID=6326 RepID=A0A1I7S8P5_BURXY